MATQLSMRRWIAGLIGVGLLVCVIGPYIVWRVTFWRAGKRMIDEVLARTNEIDPAGSDDRFPECYGAVLDGYNGIVASGVLDRSCVEYDNGTRLPRSDMPAGCRAQLDLRLSYATVALGCAKDWPKKPRLPALGWLGMQSRSEIAFNANQVVRRGVRHGLAEAKAASDPDRATQLCEGLLRFNSRFDHLDWVNSSGTANLAAEEPCVWAVEHASPAMKRSIHETTREALARRPNLTHQLEDYLLWTRAGTYGGFAPSSQLDRLPVGLRPLFDTYHLQQDDMPLVRDFATQLEWTEFERRERLLIPHAEEPDADFEAVARAISEESKAYPLPDMASRVSTLRDTYRLMRAQRERRRVIEKLDQLSAP